MFNTEKNKEIKTPFVYKEKKLKRQRINTTYSLPQR